MTDTRQVMEEAFVAIFGPEPPSEYDGRAWTRNEPDFSPAWTAYIGKRNRFHRFLDAEAWTDAAMMLVPEGWDFSIERYDKGKCAAYIWPCGYRDNAWLSERPTPALALAQACLKARENGDV